MFDESLAVQSLAAFFITLAAIVAGTPIARRMGLTDAPNARKQHKGEITVIGGAAIFVALTFTGLFWGDSNQTLITVNGADALWVFMGCGAFLVATGMLDDRFHLGVFVRIMSEVLVAIAVIELLDLRVSYLGNLFDSGVLKMGPSLSLCVHCGCHFGIINAFNMLDGMDGLLASSLVITTLVLFHLFTASQPGFVSLAIGASLLAFLVSNLNLSPLVPKTFLGDAGSKLLGFIVVCLLLAAASAAQVGDIKLIKPVVALFVVALPLYDMVLPACAELSVRALPLRRTARTFITSCKI